MMLKNLFVLCLIAFSFNASYAKSHQEPVLVLDELDSKAIDSSIAINETESAINEFNVEGFDFTLFKNYDDPNEEGKKLKTGVTSISWTSELSWFT